MGSRRHVALGTISFTVCFAAWGLIAPSRRASARRCTSPHPETALLVAVPVLLGSLARIPMGMLTDRFGGRAIFAILMAAVAVPVWWCAASDHSDAAGRRVPAGDGRILLRHRRGLRLALDAARTRRAARSASTAWATSGNPPRCSWDRWSAARVGMAGGLPRRCGAAGGLGRGVRAAGPQRPPPAAAPAAGRFTGRDDGGADDRAALLGPGGVLLPDLRRLRRVLHLPAHAAQGRVRALARRTPDSAPRASSCWPRCCARWAGGSRTASAARACWPRCLLGVVPFALLLAWPLDGAVHGGRAGLRGTAGPGQRRGLQAGAAVLPRPDRHGHRTGGRHGRPRRILPAAAARHSSATVPASSGRASLLLAPPPRCYCGGRITGLRAAAAGARPRCCPASCGAPPTGCAPAHGPRCGPRCWSPPSWWVRAICRTSTPRW